MQLNILQISPTPDREPVLTSSAPGWRACSHRRHGAASPSWQGIAISEECERWSGSVASTSKVKR